MPDQTAFQVAQLKRRIAYQNWKAANVALTNLIVERNGWLDWSETEFGREILSSKEAQHLWESFIGEYNRKIQEAREAEREAAQILNDANQTYLDLIPPP